MNSSHKTGKKEEPMNNTIERTLSKVPEVTLIFWIIKIAATTLGETGGCGRRFS